MPKRPARPSEEAGCTPSSRASPPRASRVPRSKTTRPRDRNETPPSWAEATFDAGSTQARRIAILAGRDAWNDPEVSATLKLLEKARDAFGARLGSGLLDAITWPRAVEERFFASNEEELPPIEYAIDRDNVSEGLRNLDAFEKELGGDDALPRLLRGFVASHRLAGQMMLAVGTPDFYRLSLVAYGGASTTALDLDTTNLDFARHLGVRLGEIDIEASAHRLSAEEFADDVRDRLSKRRTKLEVEIRLTDELSAKAIAGTTRLKIRSDATFEPEESRSLFLHEVETHLLTAQNGAAQSQLFFLKSGGPRTTRTQEGLAVFSEFFAQALTASRMRRLVERVKLVAMAEEGASFVELYRHLRDRGLDAHGAFLDASRVTRGGVPGGGAPFTKDASYLSGFVDVYNFMRLAVTAESREIAEVLVSGRMSLDDVEPLLELRNQGLLDSPAHLPSWLRRWEDVLTHFAFTSFLGEINLDYVERRYPWIAARASRRGR